MNLKEQIKKCYDVKGNLAFKKFSTELLESVNKETAFLDSYDSKLQERVYCVLNDVGQVITCPITKEKLRFSPQTKSYSRSKTDAYRNRVIKNIANHKKRNDEYFENIVKSYNTSNYTLLTKEQCINIFDSLMVCLNSRINSAVAKSNVDFACSMFYYTPFISLDGLDMSERIYCIKNNISTPPTDIYNVKLKFQNRFKGYSKFPSKQACNAYHLNNASKEIDKSFIVNEYITEKKSGTTSRVNVTCKTCGHTFTPLFKNALWKNIYCPGCNGIAGRSKGELEIIEYLKSLGVITIIENDRVLLDGLEVDILLPDYNLGIEFCGILWHSFGVTYPNNIYKEKEIKHRHGYKYTEAKSKNISLLTIFENEWNLKKDIVKSIIANKLGKTEHRIYARKCVFLEVSKTDSNRFLEYNHIQGKCTYNKAFGLYYEEKLVSLMCFGTRKLSKGLMNIELIRFCNKLNTTVVGGASKMLKNSNIKKCISYCDLRYSSGGLYKSLGMRLLRTTKPNYYYTLDRIHLLHRTNFQKHKISKVGDSRTEWQIMYDRGYRRIYDCGHLVFEYISSAG